MTIWPTKEDFIRRKERRIRIKKKIRGKLQEIQDNHFRKKLKKQPFIWMFTKAFLVWACIAIAALYGGWLSYQYHLKEEYKHIFDSHMNYVSTRFNRDLNYPLNLDKDDNTQWKYYLEYVLSSSCNTDMQNDSSVSLSLYNMDEKTLVAESTFDTFLELYDMEQNKLFVYRLSDEVKEEFFNTVSTKLSVYSEGFEYLGWELVNCKDIYIKGDTFIPGTLYDPDTESVLAVFAPQDKESYKHIELNYVKSNDFSDNYEYYTPDGLLVSGPYFATSAPPDSTKTTAELIDCYMASDRPWDFVDYGYTSFSADKEDFVDMDIIHYNFPDSKLINAGISQQIIDLGNGNRYLLVGSLYYDLTDALHRYLKTWCIRAALICILLSLLIAYFKFNTQKARLMQEEYRRNLTNTMAHDLKTPLMAISGYAENLLANVQTDKREHYADSIIKNVSYMNTLINNVLQLDKLESGIRINRENIELTDITKSLIQNYNILINEKNLTVDVDGTLSINADLNLMTQAIDNLIINAIKYSPNGSVISISLEEHTFTIENETDISFDTPIDDLWKPYVKGNTSRSDRNGSGIGLYIVDNIIKLHGYKAALNLEGNRFTATIIF